MTTDALRTVPLFTGMTDRSIEAISDIAEPASYEPGDVMVREGETGDTLIVITRGRARVDQSGNTVRELADGDFLGEISLIDGGPRTATVTAIEPVQALVIRRDGFGRLMTDYPAVRLGLVEALTTRLRTRASAVTD